MRHFALAALVGGLIASASAHAHDFRLGDLKIDHPWSRATAPAQANGVAYAVIENTGSEADRLVSASTDLAGTVEIHLNTVDAQGVMRMRQVEGGIEIPAGGKVALEPGSWHVMLMGLRRPLAEGELFPLTLVFEKAGETTVEVKVEAAARGGGHGHH